MLKDIVGKFFGTMFDFWDNVKCMRWPWIILCALGIVLATVVFLGAGIGAVLGIYWLLWQLYLYVVPFWFPNAPMPGYWMFAGTWFGLQYIKNAILNKGKN
jgi:hypothetical protein